MKKSIIIWSTACLAAIGLCGCSGDGSGTNLTEQTGQNTSVTEVATTTLMETTALITAVPTAPPETTARIVTGRLKENNVEIPYWDEKNFGQKYSLASLASSDGEKTEYISDQKTAEASQIGESKGKVQVSGFDAYSDSTKYAESDAYEVRGDAVRIAVKSTEDDSYYLYALRRLG